MGINTAITGPKNQVFGPHVFSAAPGALMVPYPGVGHNTITTLTFCTGSQLKITHVATQGGPVSMATYIMPCVTGMV